MISIPSKGVFMLDTCTSHKSTELQKQTISKLTENDIN